MVRPLCSLWCSCGFHVHRTPHFRSFQYTTIYDVDLRLFELKSWCSRVMLHSTRLGPVKISALSLRSALWCWIAKMRTDLSVPWGWSTQAAEDDAEIIATWEELDRNLKWMVEIASHLKDRLVTSHFKLEGGLGGTGWEQTLIRLCITHCLYFDNIMINYV